jgi:hypothetical protein
MPFWLIREREKFNFTARGQLKLNPGPLFGNQLVTVSM